VSAVFTIGGASGEILDLTAPASEPDGIVARWLREAVARHDAHAAYAQREQDRRAG
jgi:hypothetical protein